MNIRQAVIQVVRDDIRRGVQRFKKARNRKHVAEGGQPSRYIWVQIPMTHDMWRSVYQPIVTDGEQFSLVVVWDLDSNDLVAWCAADFNTDDIVIRRSEWVNEKFGDAPRPEDCNETLDITEIIPQEES